MTLARPSAMRAAVVAGLGLVLSTIAACAGVPRDQAVHIRVRNDGPLHWQELRLGAGRRGLHGYMGHMQQYGEMRPGETSRYYPLDPVLAEYNKTDIFIRPGLRYLNNIAPEEHVGTPTLAPGYYTFAYRIVGDELQMSITRDAPPAGRRARR